MLDGLPFDQPLPFRDPAGRELLDLNALLVPNPLATFYMRVAGHGLRSHGVLDGDLLAIDRSIQPQPGQLVVVAHRGEFLLRLLLQEDGRWLLAPLRPGEHSIPVEIDDIHASPLFGVAVHGIHTVGPSASRWRRGGGLMRPEAGRRSRKETRTAPMTTPSLCASPKSVPHDPPAVHRAADCWHFMHQPVAGLAEASGQLVPPPPL